MNAKERATGLIAVTVFHIILVAAQLEEFSIPKPVAALAGLASLLFLIVLISEKK